MEIKSTDKSKSFTTGIVLVGTTALSMQLSAGYEDSVTFKSFDSTHAAETNTSGAASWIDNRSIKGSRSAQSLVRSLYEATHEDWDGMGSPGVAIPVIQRAERILSELSASVPDVVPVPGPFGEVGIQWLHADNLVYADVLPSGAVRVLSERAYAAPLEKRFSAETPSTTVANYISASVARISNSVERDTLTSNVTTSSDTVFDWAV